MTAARQIGIAGLGLLGSALAHRLIQAGYSPKGYDIDAAKVAAFAKAGGIAAKLDEVAHCDVVLLAVFDTDQVEDVVTNAVLPALDERAEDRAVREHLRSRPHRGAVRDGCAARTDPDRNAGVGIERAGAQRRRRRPARRRQGRDRRRRRHHRRALSEMVLHGAGRAMAGAPSSRSTTCSGLNRLVLAEGLVFAQALGLDPAALLEVARQSAAYSQVMDIKGPKMVSGDYSAAGLHPPVVEGFQTDHRAGAPSAGRRCRSRRSTRRCWRPAFRAAKASATTPR